ncbi:putative lipase YDR444W isoform X2 [Sorghum bicolor]|uniref:putative lipase YDR444W isoform X2 n=1 Tax=Sorghum bicolor TaxID=4558 RepID=UPI000B4251E2|nr:putative lipase YDR444W isoform X2 [Sorghum bicolor]|eukprot:XP_021304975.1 putative lipase YDR444W isoform X2 [Sorghum bicolor]
MVPSTACSLPHGLSLGFSRSYNSRLLRLSRTGLGAACSSPSGSESPSGLKSAGNLYLYPLSRGSTVVCSVMGTPKSKQEPDHLLVLVHGIMASPKDWTYGEAVLKRRLGDNFFIYGRRLANEVLDVVNKMPTLRKISFLAHSLGGLFARYAIAVLHSVETKNAGQSSALIVPTTKGPPKSRWTSGLGSIAGLQPINFITLATPHLGVRGRNQLPFLQGLSILEKLAAPLAPLIVGRTGAQLFLTDGDPSKPPLLLQMASDCDDKKYILALAAFKNRVLYANVSYDHMVGWRTSSLRREKDLIKPLHRSLDGYKHIVNVEYCSPVSSEGPHFPSKAARAKEAAQRTPNRENTEGYHQMMEEEMIHGLQKVGWKKVDVNFHSSFWPYSAHNNIHVKNEWLHNAGAGVIAHVADSIKQQESRACLPANL